MSKIVLFYSPGACSLAVHASLLQAGTGFEAVAVDLRKKLQLAPDYLRLNPQGRVPTLAMGDTVLTETVAIAGYLDRRFPAAGLLPSREPDRALAEAAIQRLASDIHPLFRALWLPGWFADDGGAHDALKATATRRLLAFYAELEQRLADGQWGAGEPEGFLAFVHGGIPALERGRRARWPGACERGPALSPRRAARHGYRPGPRGCPPGQPGAGHGLMPRRSL